MSKMVTVITFTYPYEAYVLRTKLEDEGIYVELKNENTTQVHNLLSNAIGGVHVQVRQEDAEKARELIAAGGWKPIAGIDYPLLEQMISIVERIPIARKMALLPRLLLFSVVVLGALVVLLLLPIYRYHQRVAAFEARVIERHTKADQNIFGSEMDYYTNYLSRLRELIDTHPDEALKMVEDVKWRGYAKLVDYEKGQAYMRLDSLPLAIASFKNYLKKTHLGRRVLHFQLAECYNRQQLLDSACRHYRLSLKTFGRGSARSIKVQHVESGFYNFQLKYEQYEKANQEVRNCIENAIIKKALIEK